MGARSRRLVAFIAAITMGLVLTGCGGTSGSGGPEYSLGDVAAALESTSVRMVLTQTIEIDGTTVSVRAEGVTDDARGVAKMTFVASEEISGISGEMLLVDGILYANGDAAQNLGMAVPPEGMWASMPLATDAADAGFAQYADIQELIDLLHALDEGFETLGERDINGVTASGYRGSVTMSQLLAAQGITESEFRDQILGFPGMRQLADTPEFLAILREALNTEQMIEAWIDGDGRLVRMTIRQPDMGVVLAAIDDTFPVTDYVTTTQIDLSDYGVDVDLEPPPAHLVVTNAS